MLNSARQAIAQQAFAQIRAELNAPTTEQLLWQGMTRRQRQVTLLAAELPARREADDWAHFSLDEQQRIIDQVLAFGRLAQRLRRIRWRS